MVGKGNNELVPSNFEFMEKTDEGQGAIFVISGSDYNEKSWEIIGQKIFELSKSKAKIAKIFYFIYISHLP